MVVRTIAAVGAGKMGTGIAQVPAAAGSQMILIERGNKASSKTIRRPAAFHPPAEPTQQGRGLV
jgi:3-hydroxyacyl-CoA dehydrogenase